MITVSEAAQAQVKQYFEGQEIKPVRVFLSNGCGGQRLALAVDEAKPDDEVQTFGEVTVLIEKALLEDAAPVSIDFDGQGFNINSGLKFEASSGCSGCGGGCGS